MKIALGQINPTVGDISGNILKILDYANQAKSLGARLIVFPELAICGYPPLDLIFKPSFVRSNREALAYLTERIEGIGVIVGYVDVKSSVSKKLVNAAAFIDHNQIVGRQYKTLLPTYDVFDEARYFESTNEYNVFTVDDVRFGLTICEDIWYQREWENRNYTSDPVAKLKLLDPNLIINLSASPYVINKEKVRCDLIQNTAKKFNLPIIYVNQIAGNDELIFDGRSFVADRDGKIQMVAKAFEEDLIVVDFDSRSQRFKAQNVIEGDNQLENIFKALVLGVKDFTRKCGFSKVVIGLSGGIDSAVTACIAKYALGAQNVYGVAMPSKYSSGHALDDARVLANNLGIKFDVIPIDKMMQETLLNFQDNVYALKNSLSLENIQPRLRGIILMAISNEFNYLVLNTGNKSEIACGYCTLYGDMCGGLCAIGDLLKTKVYELANYINVMAGEEIIPRSTITKRPSAELRENKFDDDTLPPYATLDKIISYYVEEHLSVPQIEELGYNINLVQDVVNLIDRSEFKRKQSAPTLKISQCSFGVGWKMPIAYKAKYILEDLLCQVKL